MYGIADIQATTIAYLKAATSVSAIIGKSASENSYQGLTYAYPCVRVAIALTPSTCKDEQIVTITISCYSEQLSSDECSILSEAVTNATVEHRLSMQGAGMFYLKPPQPVTTKRTADGLWQSDVILKMLIRG